jgi:hypothetical protein
MSSTEKKIKSYFSQQKLWGMVSYQPRWGLTFKGWLSMLLFLAAIAIFLIVNIQPFLAPSAPIKAEALVIEGWIGDDGIQGAIAEFERQNYQILITIGTPILRGGYLSEYKSFAQLSAATAIKLGFDKTKIAIIPIPPTERDRTLSSAMVFKQWLQKNHPQITAVNLYSKNVHSRRSWLLYKRACEPEIKVGIIAQPTVDYDARWWWKSSEGFREVTAEAIAYFYAKLLS